MARSLIVLCLVMLSMTALVAATTLPKKEHSALIIVVGKIFCLQGNKPIKGATVNLSCLRVAEGKPTEEVTTLSNPSLSNGVYTIGLRKNANEIFVRCRVTLNLSPPSSNCTIPTDINYQGIKGAPFDTIEPTSSNDVIARIKDLFFNTV